MNKYKIIYDQISVIFITNIANINSLIFIILCSNFLGISKFAEFQFINQTLSNFLSIGILIQLYTVDHLLEKKDIRKIGINSFFYCALYSILAIFFIYYYINYSFSKFFYLAIFLIIYFGLLNHTYKAYYQYKERFLMYSFLGTLSVHIKFILLILVIFLGLLLEIDLIFYLTLIAIIINLVIFIYIAKIKINLKYLLFKEVDLVFFKKAILILSISFLINIDLHLMKLFGEKIIFELYSGIFLYSKILFFGLQSVPTILYSFSYNKNKSEILNKEKYSMLIIFIVAVVFYIISYFLINTNLVYKILNININFDLNLSIIVITNMFIVLNLTKLNFFIKEKKMNMVILLITFYLIYFIFAYSVSEFTLNINVYLNFIMNLILFMILNSRISKLI